MSNRDPFPPSKLENDFTLSGFKSQPRKTYKTQCHIAQKEEPWSRLHDMPTVSSTQRSVTDLESQPQASNDSLDLHLNTIYDHFKDCFWSKNQILYQKGVTCEQHSKKAHLEDMLKKEKENDITVWVDPKRNSINSVK